MIGGDNLFSLLDPATAFVAGVVTSLHCVGMCGPLSCALIKGPRGGGQFLSHGVYHLGRLGSYSLLGALAGMAGGGLVGWLGDGPARLAPWGFALFFLGMALGFDGFLTRWQAKRGVGRKLVQGAYRAKGYSRGLALGLATPLIPCGPLYLMLWATTMTGSALNGAMVMAAFALGTAPLLLAAQSGWSWMSVRAKPETLVRLRRSIALVAVALVCARAFVDTDIASLMAEDGICH